MQIMHEHDPQGLNLYVYCLQNPIRYIDPSGLWTKDVHEQITRIAMGHISSSRESSMFNIHLKFLIAGNLAVDAAPYAAFGSTIRRDFNGNPSRHFNRATDGTDSRQRWAEQYLRLAIATWGAADDDFRAGRITYDQRAETRTFALTMLGRGLHSIQDIEAHGNIGVGRPFAMHGWDAISGVDKIGYDWKDDNRRRVTQSAAQVRFNASIMDSVNYIDRFYAAIGIPIRR
jgi:hypothetical protein